MKLNMNCADEAFQGMDCVPLCVIYTFNLLNAYSKELTMKQCHLSERIKAVLHYMRDFKIGLCYFKISEEGLVLKIVQKR